MVKIILVVITVLLISIVGFVQVKNFLDNREDDTKPVTLTIWGVKENEEVIKAAIEGYKVVRPNVTIEYQSQSLQNYRPRVQTQIASHAGPDIFAIHSNWLSMMLQSNSVAPSPDRVMNMQYYQDTFYPIAQTLFTSQNKIYAVPKEMDGLALYYNEDILNAAGVSVPQTWDPFVNAAIRTTVIDSKGLIQTSGAAMGTTNNIEYWSDILGLLFLQQPGANLANPASPEGAETIQFFTDFANKEEREVWNSTLENATSAFAKGKVAFMFAPSSEISKVKAANPNLKFKVVPVPQLPNRQASWATFWGYAVSKDSKHQTESWRFLSYLSSVEAQKLMFNKSVEKLGVGYPYPRKDLKQEITNDSLLGAYVNQADSYSTWYLANQTQDQGINDEMIKSYQEVVSKINANQNAQSALEEISTEIQQTLFKYGVN